MADNFDKYLPWFKLKKIPSIGNVTFKKLICEFKSPEKVLNASVSRLKSISFITQRMITGLQQKKKIEAAVKPELERLLNDKINISVLTDPNYPPLLKQITDPPPYLTYAGELDMRAPCISIVGSRNATSYGLSTAKNLSYGLARKGFQVVSGMARGIDTAAHRGALEANGKTIAVMGSGLGKIYPRENLNLYNSIKSNGTIFSEFNYNADPVAQNFPVRNRIIAGISCGTIVVEAAKRSGSLITARLANEYNREVFAVPGSIKSKKSAGTHSLLKQGARLVETEMDIVDELYQFIHPTIEQVISPVNQLVNQSVNPSGKNKINVNALQNKKHTHVNPLNYKKYNILKFLEPYPLHIDELIKKSGLKNSAVSSQLLDLEFENIVLRHQGNYYSISEESID